METLFSVEYLDGSHWLGLTAASANNSWWTMARAKDHTMKTRGETRVLRIEEGASATVMIEYFWQSDFGGMVGSKCPEKEVRLGSL